MKTFGLKNGLIFGLILILVSAAGMAVQADSLWTDQSSSLYNGKPRNFEVGDLLTVAVVEQAKATQQAQSSDNETGEVSAGPGTGLLSQLMPAMGGSWESDYKGNGQTTRGGSLTANISVQVKEVNPNGLLSIEGRQVIRVNKEEQVIIISGQVRASDVSSDNVVLSTKVANAVIEFQGKGTVSETQEPGILVKFFHWLF